MVGDEDVGLEGVNEAIDMDGTPYIELELSDGRRIALYGNGLALPGQDVLLSYDLLYAILAGDNVTILLPDDEEGVEA